MPAATLVAFPSRRRGPASEMPGRDSLDAALGQLLETVSRERSRLPDDGSLPAPLRPLVAAFRVRLDEVAARILSGHGRTAEMLGCVQTMQDLCDQIRTALDEGAE